MEKFVLKGQQRKERGTSGSRRIRRDGWIPANVYGHGEKNVHLQVRADDLTRLVYAGHHMITLEFDGQSDQGLLKEIQYDSLSGDILHADFARISMDEVVEMLVPLAIQGTAKGKAAGGILDVSHPELMLRGKARDLPEHIEVDVTPLMLGDSIRVSGLDLPEGVTAILGAEEPVVILHVPRGQDADEATEEEGPSEPEVISEKKETPEEK